MSRNKEHRPNGAAAKRPPPWGRRRRRRLCVLCVCSFIFYIMNIHRNYLYIPDTFRIYFLNMFHVFSLVAPLCSLFLLIYLFILWIVMDIPYIFLIYSIFICPKYFPCIFLCMFRNGFCLLRPGEPSGGSRGNPGGPPPVTAFKMLYKNPLEIPKGIPS